VERLEFTNARGQTAALESTAPHLLWKFDGHGAPGVTTLKTQSVGQDGYTFHENRLEAREVTAQCFVFGSAGLEAFFGLRKQLAAVLNPLLGLGTLTYVNNAGAWKTAAFVPDQSWGERVGRSQPVKISFECALPFWLSVEEHIASLAYVNGGLKFPLITPSRFGLLGYQAIIDNDSDAATPIELLMDGGALNPKIVNTTTGEFIHITRLVQTGEKLYINTDPEKLEVSLIYIDAYTNEPVKTNAYGYLSLDSSLFRLIPGENRVTFRSDDETKAVKLRLTFNKRYVGV
jgi:hypothetical protein